jgi:hypothetical protein
MRLISYGGIIMAVRLLLFKDNTFTIQEIPKDETLYEVQVYDNKNIRTYASLMYIFGAWSYCIEEKPNYWKRGSNFGQALAATPDHAIADMLYHIRQHNYVR